METNYRLTSAFVLTLALLPTVGSAQSTQSAPPTPSAKDTEPTLAETTTWIETDGQAMMYGYRIQLDRRYLFLTVWKYSYKDVKLKDCVLSWTQDTSYSLTAPRQPDKNENSSSAVRVILKDLDTGGLTVRSDTLASDKPVYYVHIGTRAVAGATIESRESSEPEQKFTATSIYVRNQDDGQRLASAIKRAAVLCGAPPGPF